MSRRQTTSSGISADVGNIIAARSPLFDVGAAVAELFVVVLLRVAVGATVFSLFSSSLGEDEEMARFLAGCALNPATKSVAMSNIKDLFIMMYLANIISFSSLSRPWRRQAFVLHRQAR